MHKECGVSVSNSDVQNETESTVCAVDPIRGRHLGLVHVRSFKFPSSETFVESDHIKHRVLIQIVD